MAASSLEKSGMSITCDTSAIRPNAVPSPSSAVTTGRPIARKRAEGDQKHDDRGGEPDRAGGPQGGCPGLLDRGAAELDLKVGGSRLACG